MVKGNLIKSIVTNQVRFKVNKYSNRESYFAFLFDLILYVTSTIFQLNRDGSSWVEPEVSLNKCVLLKDHITVTPVRLEPPTPRSRVKHSTTEPMCSLKLYCLYNKTVIVETMKHDHCANT